MKTEVDLTELAAAVSNAILSFAKPQEVKLDPKSYGMDPEVEQKNLNKEIRKKRGRPKKNKAEEVFEIEPIKNDDFTAPTKRENFEISREREGGGRYTKRVPFKKKVRENKFSDNLNIAKADLYNKKGEKIIYPEHTQPRPSQQEIEYTCGLCNKKFMAFPSYIAGSVDGESQPIIRCYNCNTR